MGKIALPEMKKYNYDDALATGTVAAAGTLGILIPPSTVLIVYGILTEESIGKLFVAGILPGILLSIFFAATVALLCWRNPAIGPPGAPTSWKEKLRAITGIIEALILFLLAIGGLFLGWFGPTQAGAIGGGGALLIGLARRQLSWRSFFDAGKEGLRTSCMVIFIITGAVIFGHFMAVSRIPFVLAEWLGGLPIHPMAVMALIVFIYFIGGFFMDAMGLIVVTIPIFFPLVIP
jgi:tripartite ATP-independent transporter DctM subunit